MEVYRTLVLFVNLFTLERLPSTDSGSGWQNNKFDRGHRQAAPVKLVLHYKLLAYFRDKYILQPLFSGQCISKSQ